MLPHCSMPVICSQVKSLQAQSRAAQVGVCWDLSGIDLYHPSGGNPLFYPTDVYRICSPCLIMVFESAYGCFLFKFIICILWFLCVFIGTDALCWEQELHGTWSASFGGLLSVHKLFLCSSIPPHCRVRQSCPCFEETSFVSNENTVHFI